MNPMARLSSKIITVGLACLLLPAQARGQDAGEGDPEAGQSADATPADQGHRGALKHRHQLLQGRARQAKSDGLPGEMMDLYEQAWQAAVEAYRGGAFGTKKMKIPLGSWEDGTFRQETVNVPGGADVPEGIAREAILAAHQMHQPEQAVRWLGRLSPMAAFKPVADLRLPRTALDLLKRLLQQSRQAGQAQAVSVYAEFLERRRERLEEEAEGYRQQRRRNLLWGFGLMMAGLLLVFIWEGRAAFRHLRKRRRMGQQRWYDRIVLRSSRVTSQDEQGLVRSLGTTWPDLANRVGFDWFLKLWIPGLLVGAVVFINLAWDKSDRPGTVAICCFLGWLFLSFAGLMLVFNVSSPAPSVRRRLTLQEGCATLETEVGVFLKRRWQERFSYGEIQGFSVHKNEQRVEYVRLVSWLICMHVDDRKIVVGGKPDHKEEPARRLAQKLDQAVNPLGREGSGQA